MADVTSTAKLIVTVEGEDKVKKLAASLKALAGAGGTKKFGVGGGAGLASQMAATHVTVKRSLAPIVAGQIATAKMLSASTGQQKVTARMMAPLVAQQAIMARTMAPLAAQQTTLAKTVAPMVAGQVAAAKIAKAIARAPEVYSPQAPPPTGITDKLIASLRKRGAVGTDEEIRARYAQPAAARFPLNKKELAAQAARGAPVAAGLAEGAGPGIGAGLGRLAVGAGVITVLGGATVALGALAAAAAAVSVGAWAANKGLDAAAKTSKNIWDNLGRAKAAGKTVDEIQDRDALRDQLFGGKAEGFENRLPKLLTEQKRKKGILGDKGIFATLGLDRKTMAEMEKKGEADATGVLTRIGDKRAEIEEKIAAAKAPKQKAALEQRLKAFDKSMNLFMGKPLADAVRGLPKGEAKKFRDELKAVSDAFDQVTPKTTPKQLEQQAAAHERAQFKADQISKKREEAIGKITLPAATGFQEAVNNINARLSPAFAQITGNIGRLALEAGTKLLGMFPTEGIGAAADKVGKYLADLKLENIPEELGKAATFLKESGTKLLSEGLQSAIDNQVALWSGLGESISTGIGSAVEAVKGTATNLFSGLGSVISDAVTGMINKLRALVGAKPLETEAEKQEREGKERLLHPIAEPPATFKDRFEALPPAPVADTSAADRIREAFEALPAQGTAGGAAFGAAAESGITSASTAGGNAFSSAAQSGLSSAGTQAGGAFNSAVNASSIGSQIGSAAAAAISAAKVTVNVQGAVNAAGGGGRTAPASKGTDTPTE